MKGFVLVAAMGHCGTKWLAEVFDGLPGVSFHHEFRCDMTGWPWHKCFRHELEHGVIAKEFDGYWGQVEWELGKHAVVGDSNTWTPYIVPQVHHEALPVRRIFYLVRDGVMTMYSASRHSWVWRRAPEDSWYFDVFLRKYWKLMGCPDPQWENRTRWEKLCTLWALNWPVYHWLKETLPDVPVTLHRLEDLTTDVNELRVLVEELSPGATIPDGELRQLQRQVVNRKEQERLTAGERWAMWTQTEREAFEVICGEGMRGLGYEIPE